jgi:hypothetical protein
MSVCAMAVNDGRQAAVADRKSYGVGAGRGQAVAGALQHRRGDVDAERSPAQAAYAAGVHAGAAADLQAGASSPAQQAAERGADAERIGPRRGGSGQELVLIPVRDLVVGRRRYRQPPGLLTSPGINAIPQTTSPR